MHLMPTEEKSKGPRAGSWTFQHSEVEEKVHAEEARHVLIPSSRLSIAGTFGIPGHTNFSVLATYSLPLHVWYYITMTLLRSHSLLPPTSLENS